jgi:hypothetical protein
MGISCVDCVDSVLSSGILDEIDCDVVVSMESMLGQERELRLALGWTVHTLDDVVDYKYLAMGSIRRVGD